MLCKIKEWWTKFKQYYYDNQWLNMVFIVISLFLAVVLVATPVRFMTIKQYDKGIQLYEEKRYEEAYDIFIKLIDWKIGKRDGEEMYTKTLSKLNDITVNTYCPTCHQITNSTYLPLEERP